MDKVLDVLYGKMQGDDKNYHCPHCKAGFDFMDVIDGVLAKPVDTNKRIYKCDNCGGLFRMPE